MGLWLAVTLGGLQGLTEFLPVSSSGHLRLVEGFAGVEEPATLFDIMLHVGTLLAVVIVYRKRLGDILVSLFRLSGRGARLSEEPNARLFFYLLLAMIPTGVIGLSLGDTTEGWAKDLKFVGGALLVNGVLLLWMGKIYRVRKGAGRDLDSLRARDALIIGTGQGLGIFRGISRSGVTITAGLGTGLSQEAAAAFSFLLSIPAILAALVLKVGEGGLDGVSVEVLLAGTLTSAVVGVVALKWLLRLLNQGHLHRFAWYCFALGAVAITAELIQG